MSLIFHRRTPQQVIAAARPHGFSPYLKTVREPDDDGMESTPQAFLIMRKTTAS